MCNPRKEKKNDATSGSPTNGGEASTHVPFTACRNARPIRRVSVRYCVVHAARPHLPKCKREPSIIYPKYIRTTGPPPNTTTFLEKEKRLCAEKE